MIQQYVLMTNNYLTTEGFNIHRYRYDRYNDLKMHQHDFIEIAYVIHGFGCHIINGERYEISQGDILLCPRGIVHGIFPLSDTDRSDLEVYNILFSPDYTPELDTLPGISRLYNIACTHFHNKNSKDSSFKVNNYRFSPPEQHLVQNIMEHMLSEYTKKEKNYKELITLNLGNLFLIMDRSINSFGLQSRTKNINREIIINSMEYIQVHYDKQISVSDLASQVLLSKNYFSSIFKEYVGITVIQYIQNTKLDKACYFLTHTQYSVSEIIDKIGYTDYRFFNKIFKRKTGLTPIIYRKKYTRNANTELQLS